MILQRRVLLEDIGCAQAAKKAWMQVWQYRIGCKLSHNKLLNASLLFSKLQS